MLNKKAVGDNITQNLIGYGMSQRELARRMNVTSVTVSKWIHGDRLPSCYALYRLSKLFNVTMEELVHGIDD